MDLVIICTIDKVKNRKIESELKKFVIKNVKYRKDISKNTLIEYFYRKFSYVYLRNFLKIEYRS